MLYSFIMWLVSSFYFHYHLLFLHSLSIQRKSASGEDNNTTSTETTHNHGDVVALTPNHTETRDPTSCVNFDSCQVPHSLCVSGRCDCVHGLYPHYNDTSKRWQCLDNPLGSTCCVLPFEDVEKKTQPITYSENSLVPQPQFSHNASVKTCKGGNHICESRLGKLSSCDTTDSLAGSCVCHSHDGTGPGHFDEERQLCSFCGRGEYINGSCQTLLNMSCSKVSDHCTSVLGYDCLYTDHCSCASGYTYDCVTKRCARRDSTEELVICPHTVGDRVIGSVSCTKKSGCWRVRGSRGITAGCVDLITTLLPSECGLACKLEYQGYGTCEVTRGVVVCYSCHPGAALCPEANSILMMSSISVLYFMIRHLRSQH